MLSRTRCIRRNGPSAPARWLEERGLIRGALTLDYGCGFGEDAMFYGMEGWDPNHNEANLVVPLFARKSSGPIAYDTITCIYVLDVLPTREEQNTVVRKVVELLKPPVEDGFAYFAVHRDVPEDRMVVLPWKCLVDTRRFAIYEVFK